MPHGALTMPLRDMQSNRPAQCHNVYFMLLRGWLGDGIMGWLGGRPVMRDIGYVVEEHTTGQE